MRKARMPRSWIPKESAHVAMVALWILGIASGSIGCGDIEAIPSGSVETTWELRPAGCRSADVDSVEVWLTPEGRGPTDPIRAERSCQTGTLVANGIEPGRYQLRLFGVGADGHVPFAAAPQKVTIFPDETVRAPHALLTARPASLQTTWRFKNGRLCGANGVDRVTVSVYGPEGDIIRSEDFACTQGKALVQHIQPGRHRVEVIAQTGEPTRWAGTSEVRFQPARTAGFEAVLESVDAPAETNDD